MKNIFKILFITFILNISVVSAQELLTPEDAVAFAVKNNFDIVIAKNEADIARINNNKGAAGMLPQINITTGDVFNLNNINQRFTTGDNVVKNWVPVNSFNASLNLNWTVFDGLKMFATKSRLTALQSIGELQLKIQIQNTIAQVLNAYYDVVRQKQQIIALQESARISEERVNLSQKKLDVGYSDKTPLLQSKIDLSTQQINILKQETVLKQSKTLLNQLLSRDASFEFDVIDSIELNYNPILNQVKDSAINQYNILLHKKNIELAKFRHKEIKSQRMPLINFSTGYNFIQNNSKAGFQIFNRTYGPTFGLNALIPIYNGGAVKKEIEASAVSIATEQIKLNQLRKDIDSRILIAYQNFDYAQKMLKLNEDNLENAKENIKLSLERYRLNQTTNIEVRQAQSSYEDALYNDILAKYNSKIAEIELKKWNNELIK